VMKMTIASVRPALVQLETCQFTRELHFARAGEEQTVELPAHVPVGSLDLRMSTSARAVSDPSDPRAFYFQVRDFQVIEQEP